MYSDDVILLSEAVNDKSKMIKLSLSEDKNKILDATKWFDSFTIQPSLRIRCLAILNGITEHTFPKCKCCGANVSYHDEFKSFCSPSCSRKHGHLSDDVKEKLQGDWLKEKRIQDRLSYDNIASLLGISHIAVKRACIKMGLPEVRFNESEYSVQLKLNNKELLSQLYNDGKTMQEIADEIGSSKATVSLQMKDHGIESKSPNEYERSIKKRSAQEIELEEFIQSLGVSTTHSNRSILKGQEIDIVCDELKICFEYNGVYSHSEIAGKGRSYHLDKTQQASKCGYKLFHIFSDNWVLKKEITKSVVSSKLGKFSRTLQARKCKVVPISKSDKSSFLNNNHLQGNDKSSFDYGLTYNDELVAVMTFCKSRYNKNIDWELSRFACKINTKVIGGFSRLLSRFRKEHSGSIVSYADRTISHGDVYSKNGFELIKTNPPGYRYISERNPKRMHRANFMKAKITKEGDIRSETEIMKSNGYHKVWDCGTLSYVIT
jgi:predicted DNA-binding protein YlxM (UPF0122 family)